MLREFIIEPFESFDRVVESDLDTARIRRTIFVVNPNK